MPILLVVRVRVRIYLHLLYTLFIVIRVRVEVYSRLAWVRVRVCSRLPSLITWYSRLHASSL